MIDDSNHGWGEIVGKFEELKAAMNDLISISGNVRERFDEATFRLVKYGEQDFPEHLRPAFNRIIDTRIKSRRDITGMFAFETLTPTERRQLVADICAMYEACLIDIGRSWPEWEVLYPKADVLGKPKRRRKKKID
jgi:hypothetical protein